MSHIFSAWGVWDRTLARTPAQGYARSHKVSSGTCSLLEPQVLSQAYSRVGRIQFLIVVGLRPSALVGLSTVPVIRCLPVTVACFPEASRRGSLGPAGEVAPDHGSDPSGTFGGAHWREANHRCTCSGGGGNDNTEHKNGDQPRVCLPHYILETKVIC